MRTSQYYSITNVRFRRKAGVNFGSLCTKKYFHGNISYGTNNPPLGNIYHLKTEGPLLDVNHKICKINQTTTNFILTANKRFDPYTTKSLASAHFPYSIPHNMMTVITSLYITTSVSKEFPTGSRKNSTAINTVITATQISGAITSTQRLALCI
jgi:hypothetical protein